MASSATRRLVVLPKVPRLREHSTMLVLQPQIGGSRVQDAVRAGGRQSVGAARTGAARRWEEREREELLESDAVYVLGRVCLFGRGIVKRRERGEGDDGGERLGSEKAIVGGLVRSGSINGARAVRRQRGRKVRATATATESQREREEQRREERRGSANQSTTRRLPHTFYLTHTHTQTHNRKLYTLDWAPLRNCLIGAHAATSNPNQDPGGLLRGFFSAPARQTVTAQWMAIEQRGMGDSGDGWYL